MIRQVMIPAKDLSVIVVSHGHEHLLPACLGSLDGALEGLSAEILLVDNLPRGRMAPVLAGLTAPVHLLENARPRGFASNVNLAASVATGEHLLILNPDTEHRAGQVGDAVRFLATRPEIGMLGCTLLNSDLTPQQSFRRFPNVPFMLAKALGAASWPWQPAFFRRGLMSDVRSETPHPVDWVFGAAMLLRRSVFNDVSGMDEGFRLYYEDVDLAWRLRRVGLETWFFPDLCFLHAHQQTSTRHPFGQEWRWHVRSGLRFLWKTGGGAPLPSRRPRSAHR